MKCMTMLWVDDTHWSLSFSLLFSSFQINVAKHQITFEESWIPWYSLVSTTSWRLSVQGAIANPQVNGNDCLQSFELQLRDLHTEWCGLARASCLNQMGGRSTPHQYCAMSKWRCLRVEAMGIFVSWGQNTGRWPCSKEAADCGRQNDTPCIQGSNISSRSCQGGRVPPKRMCFLETAQCASSANGFIQCQWGRYGILCCGHLDKDHHCSVRFGWYTLVCRLKICVQFKEWIKALLVNIMYWDNNQSVCYSIFLGLYINIGRKSFGRKEL